MTKPGHNHDHCIHKALGTAERLCRERGVRLTPLRRRVLELIWQDHRAVKAYDLLDRLKPLEQTAKPATVYRALEFLIAQGLIHRVESLNAFIGCRCSELSHEVLLLICRQCGEVEELPAPDVMDALTLEIQRAGFFPEHKSVEIVGLCAHCARHPAD
ncbi:MAG: transcriptional repressor [Methylohalobius sp. ZOD2]